MKKIFVLSSIFIFLVIIVFLVIKLKHIKSINHIEEGNLDNIQYFNNYIINNFEDIKYDILNKEIIKIDNKILIGENKKQLENGYFDLKIMTFDNDKSFIYFNKIYKNNVIKEDGVYFDEEYLNESIILINKLFNLNLEKEDINCIKYNVKKQYLIVRNKDNVDNVDNNKEILDITVKNYNIKLFIEENMILIKIYF